jgi:hypothetical protein
MPVLVRTPRRACCFFHRSRIDSGFVGDAKPKAAGGRGPGKCGREWTSSTTSLAGLVRTLVEDNLWARVASWVPATGSLFQAKLRLVRDFESSLVGGEEG